MTTRHVPYKRRGCFVHSFLLAALIFVLSPKLLSQNEGAKSALQTATELSTPSGFAVATIKPTPPGDHGWKLQFTIDGFTARGVPLRKVIQEAYGIYEENRLAGGSAWVNSEDFDIEAKIDDAQAAEFKDFSLDQRRSMLQALLADRFKLAIHHEEKELPVYALVVARNGPKLHRADPSGGYHGFEGIKALFTKGGRGFFEVQSLSMPELAQTLSSSVGRIVLDQTGLTGRYDFSLHWTPDEPSASGANVMQTGALGSTEPNASWPSLFTALQEQLGLNLKPAKSSVDTLVIDHVERPSEN